MTPHAQLRFIDVASIHLDAAGWDAYRIRRRLDQEALAEAARRTEAVEPVTVEEWRGGFRIIAGFRRVAAARAAGLGRAGALVYAEGALSPREAFVLALASNAPGTTLSDADRAAALAKARDEFGLAEAETASVVAPMVGLPRSHRVVREYLAIAALPEAVLDAIAAGARSREHASALLLVPEVEREGFWRDFVEPLRLSAGDMRTVGGLAADIAAREGRGVLDVLREASTNAAGGGDACAGPAEPVAPENPSAARALLKSELARRASPVISRMEAEFDALVESLGLPPGARIDHSPNFEADDVTLTLKAADAATIARLREALERGLASGTFERMLSIAVRAGESADRGET